jgi:quercetin dioxygenase-like cupin family protein
VSAFVDLAELAPHVIWEGVTGRVVPAERVTFALIELEPGTVVPEHAHDNEQVGVLAVGSVRFRIGDEEREVGVGEAWSIPPNVPHGVVTGPSGAVVVEIFVPGRADWDGLERLDPSPPSWPVRSGRL